MIALDHLSLLERREEIVRLSRAGRVAWQIAWDLRISQRTVERHLSAQRRGRQPGKRGPRAKNGISLARLARWEAVAQARGRGLSYRKIAAELDLTARTVRRDFEDMRRQGYPIPNGSAIVGSSSSLSGKADMPEIHESHLKSMANTEAVNQARAAGVKQPATGKDGAAMRQAVQSARGRGASAQKN